MKYFLKETKLSEFWVVEYMMNNKFYSITLYYLYDNDKWYHINYLKYKQLHYMKPDTINMIISGVKYLTL